MMTKEQLETLAQEAISEALRSDTAFCNYGARVVEAVWPSIVRDRAKAEGTIADLTAQNGRLAEKLATLRKAVRWLGSRSLRAEDALSKARARVRELERMLAPGAIEAVPPAAPVEAIESLRDRFALKFGAVLLKDVLDSGEVPSDDGAQDMMGLAYAYADAALRARGGAAGAAGEGFKASGWWITRDGRTFPSSAVTPLGENVGRAVDRDGVHWRVRRVFMSKGADE